MSPIPEAADRGVPPDLPSVTIHGFHGTGSHGHDDLVETMADAIASRLAGAVAMRGSATFIASGGATPVPLYARLSQKPIDWGRVKITLSDERWVPETDTDSNAAMLRRSLLVGWAATANLVRLHTADATAVTAVRQVEARLRGLPRPFDAVLLGMGEDGHIASLFPGAEGLARALDPAGRSLAQAIAVPATGSQRITLTLMALCEARQIFLLITGMAKRGVLDKAFADGPVEVLPVRAILRQTVAPVAIYWAP